MARFRKKPVVIDAFEFTWPLENAPSWFSRAINDGVVFCQGGVEPYLTIKTLEGDHRANLGDWIIRGVQGELYPIKPDIFAATYEEVA